MLALAQSYGMTTVRLVRSVAVVCLVALAFPSTALAQGAADWFNGVLEQDTPNPDATQGPQEGPEVQESREPVLVQMRARLTAAGNVIDQTMVWRVFGKSKVDPRTRLLMTQNEAQPTFRLKPGSYVVNAALGRAHITRRVTVQSQPGGGAPALEEFVLNAGGLRVQALVDGADAPSSAVNYSIYSDRDQTDARQLVLSSMRPGVVIRLNAGIYHIVSTYGDCNASVSTDITVEAGKLTDATLTHSAAKATFKLVHRAGGEALPDTQWRIQTPQGETVKESVGALPTHILAPGSYTVIANSQGRAYQRDISLDAGQTTQVEVVMQ